MPQAHKQMSKKSAWIKKLDVLFEDCIASYWQPQNPADKHIN
jgi:hypothetical protein